MPVGESRRAAIQQDSATANGAAPAAPGDQSKLRRRPRAEGEFSKRRLQGEFTSSA
jgi:hypothetical protein